MTNIWYVCVCVCVCCVVCANRPLVAVTIGRLRCTMRNRSVPSRGEVADNNGAVEGRELQRRVLRSRAHPRRRRPDSLEALESEFRFIVKKLISIEIRNCDVSDLQRLNNKKIK